MLARAAIRLNPQSTMRNMQNHFRRSTGTARAQERPQMWPPKLPRGAFCAALRADSESARESGPRGGSGVAT
eukprot:7581404-Alexandrium_andersonii.AAC.1